MSLEDGFQDALVQVQAVASPSPDILLKLYGFYKQATAGDVSGDAPGMFDLRGKAKYEAWSARKGMSQDEAKQAYIEFVAELLE